MNDNCTLPPPFNYRPLVVSEVDYYIQHYVFPIQFMLGIAGNSINLMVLLSSGMKNQANMLLSAMAFADLGFLFCMLPHCLMSFPFFNRSIRFTYFYVLIKTHVVGLANMFSTAATFLVLAVSLERFAGVRRPMHSRLELRDTRLLLLIGGVFAFAFALNLFHHLQYDVMIEIHCDGVHGRIIHVSQYDVAGGDSRNHSHFLIDYVYYAKYTQTLAGVVIPVVAVAVLNVSLIYFLRRREVFLHADEKRQQDYRSSDIGTFQRRERKVTATVIAIVTCFSVTHLPTLGPFIWEQMYYRRDAGGLAQLHSRSLNPPVLHTKAFNNVSTLLNTLLVCGKVMNFVLFCLSSAHFRRRAMLLLYAHLYSGGGHARYCKKHSSVTNNSLPLQQPVAPMTISNSTTTMTAVRQPSNGGGDIIARFIKRRPNFSLHRRAPVIAMVAGVDEMATLSPQYTQHTSLDI